MKNYYQDIGNYNQNSKLKVYFSKSSYFVGEFLKGSIELVLPESSLISSVLIEIYVNEFWRLKNGSNQEQESNNKRIVSYNLDLKKLTKFTLVDNELLLPEGISLIPFNFRFTEDISPSFEYPLPDNNSYVRYNFRVKVTSPYFTKNGAFYVNLLSRPVIQVEKILNQENLATVKKWGLFGRGETKIKVLIGENNYKYDSKCKLHIEIDNSRGELKTDEYKVRLFRIVKYKKKNGEIAFTDELELLSQNIKAVVPEHQIMSFDYELTFRENDKTRYNLLKSAFPYPTSKDKLEFYMPSIKTKFITCEYLIKVSLYFESFVTYKHRPRVELPIYIVHQLPMDYQLEIQEQIDLENALNLSKNDKEPKKFDEINTGHKSIKEDDNDDDLPSLDSIKNVNNNMVTKRPDDFHETDEGSAPCVFEGAPAPLNMKININNDDEINLNNNNKNIINPEDKKITFDEGENKIMEEGENFSLFDKKSEDDIKSPPKDNSNKIIDINEL